MKHGRLLWLGGLLFLDLSFAFDIVVWRRSLRPNDDKQRKLRFSRIKPEQDSYTVDIPAAGFNFKQRGILHRRHELLGFPFVAIQLAFFLAGTCSLPGVPLFPKALVVQSSVHVGTRQVSGWPVLLTNLVVTALASVHPIRWFSFVVHALLESNTLTIHRDGQWCLQRKLVGRRKEGETFQGTSLRNVQLEKRDIGLAGLRTKRGGRINMVYGLSQLEIVLDSTVDNNNNPIFFGRWIPRSEQELLLASIQAWLLNDKA